VTLYEHLAHVLEHNHLIALGRPTPAGVLVTTGRLRRFLIQADGTAHLTFTDGTTFTTQTRGPRP
jgi:hypothetical protein